MQLIKKKSPDFRPDNWMEFYLCCHCLAHTLCDLSILKHFPLIMFISNCWLISDIPFFCLFQKVYKASYEKSRGSSINYCDTPKFKMDSVLKKFSDVSDHFHNMQQTFNISSHLKFVSFSFLRHVIKRSMKIR